MGIIIFPFLLGTSVFFLWTLIVVLKGIWEKTISLLHIVAGLAVSLVTYTCLFLDYKLSASAYALGAYFMFPFFMVILPFIVGMVFKGMQQKLVRLLYNVLLVSVIFSGLFIAIFPSYTFGIADYLDIPKSY